MVKSSSVSSMVSTPYSSSNDEIYIPRSISAGNYNFLSNQNKVLTKESIAEHLWGDHADMADSFDFIYSHIKNLRKKMTDNGAHDYLKSIYGVGYKLSSE